MHELIRIFAKRKGLLIGVTAFFLVVSVAVAFLMTPVYEATVLIAPAEERSSLDLPDSMGLSAIASLAGLSMPKQQNSVENMARLESRAFALDFIEQSGIKKALFPDEVEESSGEWIDVPPSASETFKRFERKVRRIRIDNLTGLIYVSIRWKTPEGAAELANAMAELINQRIREQAMTEADRNLLYLQEQLGKTTVREMEELLYSLMQEQFKSRMLAKVDPEYAYSVIDPAIPPDSDDPFQPKRLLIILSGLFIGFLIASFIVLLRESAAR